MQKRGKMEIADAAGSAETAALDALDDNAIDKHLDAVKVTQRTKGERR